MPSPKCDVSSGTFAQTISEHYVIYDLTGSVGCTVAGKSLLDNIRKFETPEGVELQLQVAGPVTRGCAWLIDVLIRGVLYTLLSFLSNLGEVGLGVMLISVFLVEWFYPVVFEVYRGATPGKSRMGLEVCKDNGTPVDWQASLIRNFLRVADFLPVLYGVGLATMLVNGEFKRLGDLVAGTLVVYKDAELKENTLPDTAPVIPEFVLLPDEQLAILSFAERAKSLTPERSAELAEILSDPLGVKGESAVSRLYGYANWMQKGERS